MPDLGQAKQWNIVAMREIHYDIMECRNILNVDNPVLRMAIGVKSRSSAILVVVDHNVEHLYGAKLDDYFHIQGIQNRRLAIPGEEVNKSMNYVISIVNKLNEIGILRRSAPIVAIGGGVVLDVAGLAASLFRRGVPYIRVPTTLLSQIDVSVACKTGVNHGGFRNRLGSYNPPIHTLIDQGFLTTMPDRQNSSGLGEILKMALIRDRALFELLEDHGSRILASHFQDGKEAREMIHRAIQGMVDELSPDLWEEKLERPTDYGHTFSPLIEMRAIPPLLHGEAVALDCILSALLAVQRRILDPAIFDRICAVAAGLGLQLWHPAFGNPILLWESLKDVVLHRDGKQNLPLLTDIGSVCFINNLKCREIEMAALELQVRANKAAKTPAPTRLRRNRD
jgi:3-dehydroquinate synthetase